MKQTSAPRSRWWSEPQLFCLVVVVFLGHFFRLDELSLRGEETHRGGIGIEMLRTGDWLVPRMQGEAVFFRPPLQNWAIAASCWLHGEASAWAIRLPGALAVLATALLLYGYCRNFLSALGAFSAGAAFATMLQVLELGRLAETESLFTFFVSGSLLIWHWGYVRGWADWKMWSAAYFMAGLGMLTKGTQAPVYLVAGTGFFLLCSGQLRRFFRPAHLAGVLTFAVVFGCWFVPYFLAMGAHASHLIVFGEAGMRLTEGFSRLAVHILEFPLNTLACTLPWSLVLVAYLSRDFRAGLGEARPLAIFCGACVAATLPSCWLIPAAVPRYWLPMYPCLAPLIGVVAQRRLEAWEGLPQRRRFTALLTFASLIIGITALASLGSGLRFWPVASYRQPFGWAVALCLTGAILGYVALTRRQACSVAPVFALTSFVALCSSIWFVNQRQGQSFDIAAAADHGRLLPPGARLISFGRVHHRFVYFHGAPIQRIPWPERPQLPAGITHFCFNATDPRRPPFLWERIAVIDCDRYPSGRIGDCVIIGRIVARDGSNPSLTRRACAIAAR